jgi:hypothetical protein
MAEPTARLRVIQSVDPALPVGLVVNVPAAGGVIGRSPDVAICLAGNTVSRRHARLTPEGGRWVLTPLTDTNATFVDGKPIEGSQPVVDGTPFQVGGVVCTLAAELGTSPVLEPLAPPVLLEVHDDGGACTVFADSTLLPIPPAPAAVLGLLAANAGKPVHRWDLLEPLGEAANLDKTISLLRRGLREAMEADILDRQQVRVALGVDDDDPTELARQLVVTRRGHGYLLALDARRVRTVRA